MKKGLTFQLAKHLATLTLEGDNGDKGVASRLLHRRLSNRQRTLSRPSCCPYSFIVCKHEPAEGQGSPGERGNRDTGRMSSQHTSEGGVMADEAAAYSPPLPPLCDEKLQARMVQLRGIFDSLDTEGTGVLNQEQLKEAMNRLGFKCVLTLAPTPRATPICDSTVFLSSTATRESRLWWWSWC